MAGSGKGQGRLCIVSRFPILQGKGGRQKSQGGHFVLDGTRMAAYIPASQPSCGFAQAKMPTVEVPIDWGRWFAAQRFSDASERMVEKKGLTHSAERATKDACQREPVGSRSSDQKSMARRPGSPGRFRVVIGTDL
ncbi:hypothetical protein [Azospirillum sp. B510]|uniref:hypothetical protein n=1 Tax=Azospirillum sp. (strain B510) TaxID=137722 RepID=UPI0011D0C598|nr:hypothetical protein [Azospirillum sp. B510]